MRWNEMMLLLINSRITIDNLKGEGEGGKEVRKRAEMCNEWQCKRKGDNVSLSVLCLAVLFLYFHPRTLSPSLSHTPSSRFRSLLFYWTEDANRAALGSTFSSRNHIKTLTDDEEIHNKTADRVIEGHWNWLYRRRRRVISYMNMRKCNCKWQKSWMAELLCRWQKNAAAPDRNNWEKK